LPDTVVDRVLVVHAVETVQGPADMLHEVSRILSPGGRVILVVPNRRGLWARMDRTPFGQGQPFSRSQLRALMRGALLSPDGWAETLYIPPVRSKLLLSSAGAWERLGLGLSLPVRRAPCRRGHEAASPPRSGPQGAARRDALRPC
jgi:SAM-dependent methyltransferase